MLARSTAAPKGLKTVLVEREAAGGQAGLSSRIENYLGFPSGLSGADLARRGVAQVRRFGTEVLAPADAVGLLVEGEYRVVKLSNGQELAAHSVVIATGVQWRRLDVPGMERLTAPVFTTAQPLPKHLPAKTRTFTSWAAPTRRARQRCISPKSRAPSG